MNERTALIAGANGFVGGFVLKYLLDDPKYKTIIAIVRSKMPLKHKKLIQYVIDFEHLEQSRGIIKADDIFSCLGTTRKKVRSMDEYHRIDVEYPIEIARIARANGASQFLIVSAVDANPGARIYYSRFKGEVEEEIKKIPFKSVHFFRPSFILGERSEFRYVEKIGIGMMHWIDFLLIGKLRKYKGIQAGNIAKAMVWTAKQDTDGVYIYSYDEMMAINENI